MNGQLEFKLTPPPRPVTEALPPVKAHHVLEFDGAYAYAIEKYDVDPDIVRQAINTYGSDYEAYPDALVANGKNAEVAARMMDLDEG